MPAALQYAPAFLRLALHDALTWDAPSRTGGANGSIRTEAELGHAGVNAEYYSHVGRACSSLTHLCGCISSGGGGGGRGGGCTL